MSEYERKEIQTEEWIAAQEKKERDFFERHGFEFKSKDYDRAYIAWSRMVEREYRLNGSTILMTPMPRRLFILGWLTAHREKGGK